MIVLQDTRDCGHGTIRPLDKVGKMDFFYEWKLLQNIIKRRRHESIMRDGPIRKPVNGQSASRQFLHCPTKSIQLQYTYITTMRSFPRHFSVTPNNFDILVSSGMLRTTDCHHTRHFCWYFELKWRMFQSDWNIPWSKMFFFPSKSQNKFSTRPSCGSATRNWKWNWIDVIFAW